MAGRLLQAVACLHLQAKFYSVLQSSRCVSAHVLTIHVHTRFQADTRKCIHINTSVRMRGVEPNLLT
jgi:hypothetical protein